jgi:hypothetical protein
MFSDPEAIITGFYAVFRIRIGSEINEASGSGSEIGIRIQEGKNDPQNRKKFKNFMFSSAGCFLLRAEGFSCSLDVLCGGLQIENCCF